MRAVADVRDGSTPIRMGLRMRTSLQLFGIFAVLYPAGWFGGLYALSVLGPRAAPQLVAHRGTKATPPGDRGKQNRTGIPPMGDSSLGTLEDADANFFRGHWELAKRQYEALAAAWDGQLPDAVAFRIAVAAEAIGRFDQALDEYQRLSQESERVVIAEGARLGRARVWCELGRNANARHGLWTFLLQQEADDDSDPESLGEATHRLAHQLKHEASRSQPADLLAPMAVVSAPNPRAPNEVLRWLLERSEEASSREADPETESSEPEAAAFRSRRLGPTAEEIYITARLGRVSSVTLLEQLAAEAEIPILVSSAARIGLAEYRLPFAVRELKLTILLDALADLQQLVWTVEEDRIEIHCRDEVGEDAVTRFFARAAERMLRRSLTTFPEHHLAAVSAWAMADLAFARTDFPAAMRRYQRLLDEFPRLDGRASVHFNLAKSFLATGRADEALRAFFRAVDHGVGESIQPVAYLYAGRLLIEDDQLARAARALDRSLALANANPWQAESVLALAGLHLLNDSPNAANQTMMEHRSVLATGPYRDRAAFLAALARYQAAHSSTGQERRARVLADSLAHIQPDDFWIAHGFLLIATAYRELGLVELANAVLIQGTRDKDLGTIREWMLFELALNHYRSGSLQPGREVLRELSLARRSRWSEPAGLLLVQTKFDAGDDEACLRLCRELLRGSNTPSTHAALLAMMGRVYQRQGKHLEAAMCFTGHLPSFLTDDPEEAEEVEKPKPIDGLAPWEKRRDVGRT